jgi:hypothetical protein
MNDEDNITVWKWLGGQPQSFDQIIEAPFDDKLHEEVVSSQQGGTLSTKSTPRSSSCKKTTSRDKMELRKGRKSKIVYGDARYRRRARLRKKIQEEDKENERVDSMSPNTT